MDLFNALPLNDTWGDAKLIECYFYLWTNKRLAVPKEWWETMARFTADLKKVPRLVFRDILYIIDTSRTESAVPKLGTRVFDSRPWQGR